MKPCTHRSLVSLGITGRHPWPDRMWLVETCNFCGAQRLAEHERVTDGPGDVRVVSRTPWRTKRVARPKVIRLDDYRRRTA